MKCKIKRPKTKNLTIKRVYSKDEISIEDVFDEIVDIAATRDSSVTILGSFILFSTWIGDVWLLDPQDGLALCLARDGSPRKRKVRIVETEENFSIEWESQYAIDGNLFVVTNHGGEVRAIMGYPTKYILKAMKQI